ncbi:RDD family protein [Candidatus Bathyarchaeota archaeon]|nr:RDD family protein [Candidatus Bathyarchaeota archaeon]
MPYCKKCGNELPEGAKYCPVCGTSASTEETSAASTVQTASPVSEISGVKLAFWGERFAAWLIDVIIIGMVVGILGVFSLLAGVTWWSGWPGWLPFFNFNLGGVIYFLYWMFMDGLYRQSFGKMAMRLKVTRLDGSQIGMGSAALESIGKAFLLPLDCLLGWILYPKRRQRIFNYISETIVVKVT